jgi:soluble lytic murein transglycosylase-like protein
MKLRASLVLFLAALPLAAHEIVLADIFVRINKKGLQEFSNAPVGPGWTLYAVEAKQKNELKFVCRPKEKSLDEIIQEAALIYGVDADLIRAIVRVESNSDPYAVSRRGAQGLMQLMPATAKSMCVHAPFDPRSNVGGGARYIKDLLTAYGDLKLALAAYNAGPAAVKKYAGIPPYRETKQYIKKVLKHYNRLRKHKKYKAAGG